MRRLLLVWVGILIGSGMGGQRAAAAAAGDDLAVVEQDLQHALKVNAALGQQVERLTAHVALLQLQLRVLRGGDQPSTARVAALEQALGVTQQALGEANKSLAAAREDRGVLQERLKTVEQATLSLSERDSQLTTLQRELERVKQELSAITLQLQTLSAQNQERDEKVVMERKALLTRIGDLEQELKRAREIQGTLQGQLTEREVELKRAESVIHMLQTAQPPKPPVTPSVSANSAVTVHQVNEEFHFVVLSIKGVDWAQKGMAIELANQDSPIATAQLTELDGAGFAVAEITHQINPLKPIHKGDVLMVKPLLRPGVE